MSTPTYTTAAKVASHLRLKEKDRTRLVFDATTDPTLTEVEDMIFHAEEQIDRITRHAWRSTSVTDEMYNFEYARWGYHGYSPPLTFIREKSIKLRQRNIRGPFIADTDKIEVWESSQYVDYVANKTEGRAEDWWCDYKEGILYFVSSYPTRYRNAVRMTYRYGHEATVPKDIEKATTLMVAIEIAGTEGYSFIIPEGGQAPTLGDKIDQWEAELDKILAKRTELLVVW